MPSMTIIDEKRFQQKLTDATALGADPVFTLQEARWLVYASFRYKEICELLQRSGCGGDFPNVVLDVSRLVGEHQAMAAFASGLEAMPVPQGAAERELQRWRDWAQIELKGHGLDHLLDDSTDAATRGLVSSQLTRVETEGQLQSWRDWALERIAPDSPSPGRSNDTALQQLLEERLRGSP